MLSKINLDAYSIFISLYPWIALFDPVYRYIATYIKHKVMTISSVSDYNELLVNLSYSLIDKATVISKKYAQGTINIFDKMRFLLLTRYIKHLYDEAVFESHDISSDYAKDDFVVDGSGNFYICLKDIINNPGMIPVTNTTYWNPHLQFTYDYTAIDTSLQHINRLCGTNYSI